MGTFDARGRSHRRSHAGASRLGHRRSHAGAHCRVGGARCLRLRVCMRGRVGGRMGTGWCCWLPPRRALCTRALLVDRVSGSMVGSRQRRRRRPPWRLASLGNRIACFAVSCWLASLVVLNRRACFAVSCWLASLVVLSRRACVAVMSTLASLAMLSRRAWLASLAGLNLPLLRLHLSLESVRLSPCSRVKLSPCSQVRRGVRLSPCSRVKLSPCSQLRRGGLHHGLSFTAPSVRLSSCSRATQTRWPAQRNSDEVACTLVQLRRGGLHRARTSPCTTVLNEAQAQDGARLQHPGRP